MPISDPRPRGDVRALDCDGAGDDADGRARRGLVLDRGPDLGRWIILHVHGELLRPGLFGHRR